MNTPRILLILERTFGKRPKLLPRRGRHAAFTLVEMMVVVTIMVVMMGLAVPSLRSITFAGDITKAAYDVAGVLENARAYATAHNTYVWVGFYEEDASQGSAISGTGRIVLSIVASRDGTTVYDPKAGGGAVTSIDPSRLTQVNKLVKINNMHLKTATSASDVVFPQGLGTGNTFKTRPVVNGAAAQIGDISPSSSLTPFQYPVGSDNLAAQYTFSKVIQFNPRGEVRVNNTMNTMGPILEIGLQPTRGTLVDATNQNVAAVQVTGLLGNVKIYRQ